MYLDMDKYQKEDIKDPSDRSYVDGFELAMEDIKYALSNYEEEYDDSLPALQKICLEVASDFADYLQHYMTCTRDSLVVSILDGQEC